MKISLIILWLFKFHTFLQRSHTFSSFKENFSQSLWLILINGSNHNHIKVIMAPQRALFRLSAFGETLDLLLITIFEMKKIWKDFFRSWVYLLRHQCTIIYPCGTTSTISISSDGRTSLKQLFVRYSLMFGVNCTKGLQFAEKHFEESFLKGQNQLQKKFSLRFFSVFCYFSLSLFFCDSLQTFLSRLSWSFLK